MIHIGFLGNTFCRHSCGYLLERLISGLDRRAKISFYNLGFSREDELTVWFSQQGRLHQCGEWSLKKIVDDILESNISVLIDIDGLTFPRSCHIIAVLRNSPRHPKTVSWMGFSPSGFCDYVIGDIHLIPLPEIYREEIIYLPNCYISSGNFKVSTPEFNRKDLDLPEESFVYYFCQKPIKVNGFTLDAINSIMGRVPEAYLLLKTFTEEDGDRRWLSLLDFPDRTRFLPCSEFEEQSRANLSLVDVMLDSFPYNGTLTTLEALWMGIPVVSRYGQRWASRQGKTLLHQVGLPTFPDWDGYIDYAVKLGTDMELLAQTKQKIKESYTSSPLWDYQQHATDFLAALEGIL